MKIILIRHGETEWNAMQKFQGHTDIHLNINGHQQAERTAEYLIEETVEAIYCSDLTRTRQTAEKIANRLGIDIITDKRLREFSFGEWEGKTFTEVKRDYPDEYSSWYSNSNDYKIPGAETFTDFSDRVWQTMQDIKKKHCGTVIIATHGGVIKAILLKLEVIKSNSVWSKKINPASITSLTFKDEQVNVYEIGKEVS